MARQELDREDLLREATALVPRIELNVDGFTDSVFIGFRGDAGSIYFGQHRVYHFNSRNELRRGYDDGRLIKAESGRLVSMVRHRTDQSVELQRHEWMPEETAQYLERLDEHLTRLAESLRTDHYSVVGQVPEDGDVVSPIARWIDHLRSGVTIADSANVE